MDTDNLQRNFEGYLSTSSLWCGASVYGLEPYSLKSVSTRHFTGGSVVHLRLGKMVERFVFHQLATDASSTILAENIQIQDDKLTIGEMDALLLTEAGPVHLEIIYKFYLYDPHENATELTHWIGPNKKDRLLQKLTKLKDKQMPLLYHPNTQPTLNHLGIELAEIKQQVLFKAQLYVPLDFKDIAFSQLNAACVKGFYIRRDELCRFKGSQFYIPDKRDWIMDAEDTVVWMDYADFSGDLTRWLDRERSPLCWLKDTSKIQKFFVVWW